MILLNDILQLSDEDIKRTKIRFNQSSDDWNPLKFFINGNERLLDGQFWNYKKMKSFKEGQIAIGFIKIDTDRWLLFNISIITKDLNIYNGVGYEYESIETFRKYFGRLIIRFKNKSQNLIRNASSVIENCELLEIIDDEFRVLGFPGYENVNVSYDELKTVIDKKDWKSALLNQKAVYLITDTETAKRYVGSAYGENMLYGRWKSYVDTYHGGNKDLKKLENDYIAKHFRYSILEIYKATTDDNTILGREQHWMKVLLTKDKRFGYNN